MSTDIQPSEESSGAESQDPESRKDDGPSGRSELHEFKGIGKTLMLNYTIDSESEHDCLVGDVGLEHSHGVSREQEKGRVMHDFPLDDNSEVQSHGGETGVNLEDGGLVQRYGCSRGKDEVVPNSVNDDDAEVQSLGEETHLVENLGLEPIPSYRREEGMVVPDLAFNDDAEVQSRVETDVVENLVPKVNK